MIGAKPPLERRFRREDLDTTRMWNHGSDGCKTSTPILRPGERADSFALDVGPTEIGIAPIGKPTFAELEAEGRMRRLPPGRRR
jgi:hypothetical protein